jgi:hypothetical protein
MDRTAEAYPNLNKLPLADGACFGVLVGVVERAGRTSPSSATSLCIGPKRAASYWHTR